MENPWNGTQKIGERYYEQPFLWQWDGETSGALVLPKDSHDGGSWPSLQSVSWLHCKFCCALFFVLVTIILVNESMTELVESKRITTFKWPLCAYLNTCKNALLKSIFIFDEWKTNLMSLAILFHLCAQHVSDISISIFRSLRLCWWIATSVVLFSVRCVLAQLVVLQPAKQTPPKTARTKSANAQRTENKTTDVVIH